MNSEITTTKSAPAGRETDHDRDVCHLAVNPKRNYCGAPVRHWNLHECGPHHRQCLTCLAFWKTRHSGFSRN